MELKTKAQKNLKELAPMARKLLLAVSGGADSVAMLMLFKDFDYEIAVAHFDHNLRKSSANDCKFVEKLCEHFDIPFYTERADVAEIAKQKGWNIEDAARRLRYAFLTRTAKKIEADVVLLAHNQNDQAETVLLQLLRGAAYLKGMKARQGQIVRPLLDIKRKELEDFLTTIGQSFVTDASNFDLAFARAHLRHHIIPTLNKRYPDVIEKLAKLAAIQQEIYDYMSKEAGQIVDNSEIDIVKLSSKDHALKRQAVAEILKEKKLLNSSKQIEEILANLNAQQ